jgi:hypothetical protein
MAQDASVKELAQIDKRLQSEPVAIAVHRVFALKGVFRVFEGNSRELWALLALMHRVEIALPLLDGDQPQALDGYLDDVERSLHNFLASATSLIDHTRRHIQLAYSEESRVRIQYSAGVEARFASWEIAEVVKGLRNYTLHRQLPVARSHLVWSPDQGARAGVVLSRTALLEWDGWKPQAREFLAQASSDELSLDDIVREYSERVREFYDWFGAF